MIEARHSYWRSVLFDGFVRVLLSWYFREVKIVGDYVPRSASTMLISNHFSWWDGFFAWYLNQKLIHRRIYVMMLEEQLKIRPFFARVGAFGIKTGRREVMKAIRYSADVLSQPGNLLVMFPQGIIQSQHRSYLNFQRGVEEILKGCSPAPDLLFCATLVDYYSFRRPSLTMHLRSFEMPGADKRTLESAFNEHLALARNAQDGLWIS
ncbi:MAG: lysophospholipid acyltransferase family protein [Bacteroidales bacterium]